MQIKDLLKYGKEFLKDNLIDDYDFDSKELLCFTLNLSETHIIVKLNCDVSYEKCEKYKSFLQRRAVGEPLQYIIGKWYFLGNEFNVGKGVLIPRPETEELTDICINYIKDNKIKVVYDLCAGTGCIGISVAKEFPDIDVYLFEKYSEAAFYADENIKKHSLTNVTLIIDDIFNGRNEKLPVPDLIISNPPYIPISEINTLQREVKNEPINALTDGNDGLDFYRCIFEKWINGSDNIKCAFECGENQADFIADLFSVCGNTDIKKDMYGTDRFVFVNF